MEAYARAVELGAAAIEIDVRLTSDGHLAVIHDETLDRTTNGTGLVRMSDLEKIQKLDAGSWFNKEFSLCKVPTLSDVLEQVTGNYKLCIEIKDDGEARRIAGALADVLNKQSTNRAYVVSSFNLDCLRYLKTKSRDVKLVPWMPEDRPADLQNDLNSLESVGAVGMFHTASLLSPDYVEAVRARGFETWLWSAASEPEIEHAVNLGPDYVSCGDVEMARRVVAKLESQ